MATQPYLDATRGGSFTVPADWEILADAWEASAFDVAATEAWVNAEIESPAVAASLMTRTVTPEDVALIQNFFTADALPPLSDSLAAISFIKAALAGGGSPSENAKVLALTDFFAQLSTYGVTIST